MPSAAPAAPLKLMCTLEYSGARGITAIGPITGRRYHFAGPGARLDVDVRDRDALLRVPGIRRD